MHDKKFNSVGLVGGIKMNKLKRRSQKGDQTITARAPTLANARLWQVRLLSVLGWVYDQFAEWRETPGMATKMRRQFAKLAQLPNATRILIHSTWSSATTNEEQSDSPEPLGAAALMANIESDAICYRLQIFLKRMAVRLDAQLSIVGVLNRI